MFHSPTPHTAKCRSFVAPSVPVSVLSHPKTYKMWLWWSHFEEFSPPDPVLTSNLTLSSHHSWSEIFPTQRAPLPPSSVPRWFFPLLPPQGHMTRNPALTHHCVQSRIYRQQEKPWLYICKILIIWTRAQQLTDFSQCLNIRHWAVTVLGHHWGSSAISWKRWIFTSVNPELQKGIEILISALFFK